jgi:uncharacterized membrane protein YphA (DoxX/SURF4 family)
LIERLTGAARAEPGADAALWALAALRVFTGVLWLANLSWKLPPDFGRDDPEGLLYNVELAEEHAVFGFLQTFMREVVIPNFTAFGWLVFLVEATVGTLLVLGLFTRLAALAGLVQALLITLLVVRAPDEWFWTYAMFLAIHAVLFLTPAAARLSLDALVRSRRAS